MRGFAAASGEARRVDVLGHHGREARDEIAVARTVPWIRSLIQALALSS